jgi:hypothetical protein
MRHAYQVIIATTWHYILAKPNPRLLKYQLLTAHTHAATVKDQLHGTHVPVEEPFTARICLTAKLGKPQYARRFGGHLGNPG